MSKRWDELDRRIEHHLKFDVEPCEYIPTVMCEGPGKRCKKCGWNPEVEWKRKKRIRERAHEQTALL